MSTDWNVYCRTCDATHPFNDANHREELMHRLIRHSRAIAGLLPLLNDPGSWDDIEFSTSYGRIDVVWFAKHLGHDLVPRDEYGRCADQCGENVKCECCGTTHRCHLYLKHPGPCAAKSHAAAREPRWSFPSDVLGRLAPGWCPMCGKNPGDPCEHPEREERTLALAIKEWKEKR